MSPTRTEDDLRAVFADEAPDVCSGPEMLSRIAATRPRRRQRWLPALAACAAVVVIAVIVVALTSGGPGDKPTPPLEPHVPTDWRTVSYPTWHITLQAPPEWRSYQYEASSGPPDLIGYLSTAALHAPCVHNRTTTSCNGPTNRLSPHDLLVAWWAGSPVRTPGISHLRGGSHTTVGGRPALLVVSPADESCAAAGGSTSIAASIGGSRDPDSQTAYRMQACLGADADRSDVLTMLHTVRFGRHPASATIHGRLAAVGGPAPGAPRPLPGTVTVRTPTSEITVPVGKDGRYSVEVAPGHYQVEGHSPYYGDNKYLCRAAQPVTAGASAQATANVYCQEA